MSKSKDWLKDTFITRTHGYLDISPKRTMFIELGEEFSGKPFVRHNSGYELMQLGIKIPFKKWEIELTESDTRPLKFEIEIKTNFDFEFVIGWEDFVERVLKKLGKREIEVGNSDFDKHYMIESKNPEIIQKIFSKEVQVLMLKHNVYSISGIQLKKEEKMKFTTVVSRTISKKEDYIELIQLQLQILNNLDKAGILQ